MKHLPLHDFARLDYSRLLWRNSAARARLLAHWTDSRHPYRERFLARRELIEALLAAPVEEMEASTRRHGSSLRAAIREIPPVFGQFWAVSKMPGTIAPR